MAIGKMLAKAASTEVKKSSRELAAAAEKRVTKDMGRAERVEPARLSGPKAADKSVPSYGDRLKKAAAVGAAAGAVGYAATRGDGKEASKPSSAPAKKAAAVVAAAPSAAKADSAPAKAAEGKSKTSAFGSAFAAARKAGEKEFTFNGKRYHTKTKEEVEAKKKEPTMSRGSKDEREVALSMMYNKGGMVKKGKC